LREARRGKDTRRLSTRRLSKAAIKDRGIAARGKAATRADVIPAMADDEVLQILGKMVKQRQESARAYEEGGRIELAEQERSEISVIEEFLPRQLDASEVTQAIHAAISETGAAGIRDMGRVMGALKSKYTGQMDFGTVGPQVKAHLA